ncbi:MAG: DMT family transporter [Deltaproteobacteria bacterium]|jgi:drug/metabolite transporter (DMT)-like permease|nr:DMT family transporter [Deltaproteobacteria bacterium]
MKAKSSALLTLLFVAVMWSTSGVLIKSVTWSPLALASSRGLVAALAITLLKPGGFNPKALTKTHWLAASIYGSLSLVYVSAMKLTTAANAIVLIYTAPIWVGLLAPVLLRERTAVKDWLFMAVMFAGIILFFLDALSPDGLLGNFIALAGGLLYGLQVIAFRKLKDAGPANVVILGNFITFALGLPFWGAPWPSLSGWLFIVGLGVFQLGLPYYLYALTVPKVSSLELILVPMLEPILCPILVFLFLGERPGRWALYGAAIVMTAVIVWSVLKVRDDNLRIGALAA